MKLKVLIFIILLSLLPLVLLFITPDLPHTHDGFVHLSRMAAYYKALNGGQMLPRWAGDLNYGNGLPLFNFIYHTPYLISSLFIGLGINLVTTFKLVMSISYILSGISMLLFAQTFFKKLKTALLITVLYLFAPFRIAELLIRGSFGELYTYAFLPLVLFCMVKYRDTDKTIWFVLTALTTGLLIISHNSISLIFFGVCVLFTVFFMKSVKQRTLGLSSLGSGLALSAFYWIPAMLEHKYTYGDLFMKDLYKTHFPPLYQLVLPNLNNNQNLQTGGVPMQIGIVHILSLIALCYCLFRLKKIQRTTIMLFFYISLLTIGSLTLMLGISRPIWERISLLRQFQFPWRFLSVISFSSSLAGFSILLIPFFQKKAVYISLIVLTIFSTVYYWKPVLGFDKIPDEQVYWNYPLDTTYFGETDVIWSAGPAKEYPKSRAEIMEGKGVISNIRKQTILHTYTTESKEPIRVVDHTEYFPGWRVYVDGIKTPIEFQDQNWRGLITFAVPAGTHNIKVIFEKSKIQQMGEYMTYASGIVLMGLLFLPFVKPKKTIR